MLCQVYPGTKIDHLGWTSNSVADGLVLLEDILCRGNNCLPNRFIGRGLSLNFDSFLSGVAVSP